MYAILIWTIHSGWSPAKTVARAFNWVGRLMQELADKFIFTFVLLIPISVFVALSYCCIKRAFGGSNSSSSSSGGGNIGIGSKD